MIVVVYRISHGPWGVDGGKRLAREEYFVYENFERAAPDQNFFSIIFIFFPSNEPAESVVSGTKHADTTATAADVSLTLPSGVVDARGIFGGGRGFSAARAYNNHNHHRRRRVTRVYHVYVVCTHAHKTRRGVGRFTPTGRARACPSRLRGAIVQ